MVLRKYWEMLAIAPETRAQPHAHVRLISEGSGEKQAIYLPQGHILILLHILSRKSNFSIDRNVCGYILTGIFTNILQTHTASVRELLWVLCEGEGSGK